MLRRLPVLAAALVLIDTMLYAAMTPLLPHLLREFHLSKSSAGFLVAAYAAGTVVGGLAGGVAASHLGPRKAVLVGLALMGVSTLGFAFASSFSTLIAARLVQGLGSGFTWSGAFAWLLAIAPPERRGAMLGTAMGSAAFGAMCGPVFGAAAAIAGRGLVFGLLALTSLVLAAWALTLEPAPAEHPSYAAVGAALHDRSFLTGLGLMAVAPLVLGALSLLGPLHLAHAGWGPAAIGAVWLTSAALGSVQAPVVGRLSDRLGPLPLTRGALALGALLSLALAVDTGPLAYVPLIVLAARAYALPMTTSFVVLAEGAERTRLPQGLTYGLSNTVWAVGAVVGPAGAGALASASGDWLPFVIAAALCVASLAAIRPLQRTEAVEQSVPDLTASPTQHAQS
jgi:MFS family permease